MFEKYVFLLKITTTIINFMLIRKKTPDDAIKNIYYYYIL